MPCSGPLSISSFMISAACTTYKHILTYNDRTVTHLHIKWGVALGPSPHRRRSWYSTFAPFPDTCPLNQPALGQTYATVVFGEGRMSGEQMLTVGRGLWTTATDQWRAFPASGLAAVIYVSDNCLGTQHSALWPRRRVVLQRQTNCLQI